MRFGSSRRVPPHDPAPRPGFTHAVRREDGGRGELVCPCGSGGEAVAACRKAAAEHRGQTFYAEYHEPSANVWHIYLWVTYEPGVALAPWGIDRPEPPPPPPPPPAVAPAPALLPAAAAWLDRQGVSQSEYEDAAAVNRKRRVRRSK